VADPRALFADHLRAVCRGAEEALRTSAERGAPFDGILLHSGSAATYHGQDRPVEFQPVPHFARFAPLRAPDQLIALRPGAPPRLVRTIPRDFWYEPAEEPDHPFREHFETLEIGSLAEAERELGELSRFAYVGNDPGLARRAGIDPRAIEPEPLLSLLDWQRSLKTPYEIECIREAARVAGLGHAAALRCATERASERQIHAAYLAEAGLLERDTPYTSIVAWDDRSAVLHYETKRTAPPDPGHTFLIDAGATAHGYASDVTRTYAQPGAHPVFAAALLALESLQRELVARIRPGLDYVELHEQAARGVCGILSSLGVLRVDAAGAFERGIDYPFLPHGVGHHLGLQAHDVAGDQAAPTGGRRAPPPRFPYLRTTRELAPGQVVTVEPGLYFIPMLLEPHREGPDRDCFAWDLIDALYPCGGIRIEDDVAVTRDGREDLSRPFVPGSL
jgi:Xaa-Pro dipeptidase